MSKYKWLAEEYRSRIENGFWRPGEKLKNELELSQEAGVSRQTVRHALDILSSSGLIDRVQGSGTYVSRTLSPEGAAPEAPGKSIKTIGVIKTYMDYYIFPRILGQIMEEMRKEGYYILLCETRNRVSVERGILKDFLEKPLSGVIVECSDPAHSNPNADLYAQLREKQVPVLFMNGNYDNVPNTPFVDVNDRAGGYWLTERLLSEGCRTIGGVFKNNLHGGSRYYGCIQAMVNAGLPVDEDSFLWFNTPESAEYMDLYAENNGLDVLAKKDAIVCYNDACAINLMDLFSRFGYLKIPRIACFDNTERMRGRNVLTLTYPCGEIGQHVAQKMLAMLKGETVESEVIPWAEMMER